MDENNSGSMAAEKGGAQKTWISRDRKGCGYSSCRASRVGIEGGDIHTWKRLLGV